MRSESVRGRPAPALRGLVARYDGYRQQGVAPARHLGLPSPFMTVIVTLHEPLEIARHVDPARPASRYDALVGGLHATPVVVAHDGAQSGIQLRVGPLASRSLFGCPAGELASLDVAAADVLGPLAGELHERLAVADRWQERFAILDAALSARAAPDRGAPAAIAHAWRLLLASGGRTSVAVIAHEVGWSERHFANRFRQEIGLTPKLAARVIRFDRARQALQADHRSSGRAEIARAAADAGYFDQSHLDRDFTEFATLSPSRWLAHEFGNVQDDRLLAV
ncbi:MAG: helix-turn-helix domain-containing protein [Solirubrobacteraceae bacterium]